MKTACRQLRALGKRPATKYQKKKNLGSRAALARPWWLGCSDQPLLVNEPLASALRAACEDEEGKDFTPLESVSVFWQYQAAGNLLA